MKLLLILFVGLIGLSTVTQTNAKTDKVFCFFGSWSTYRTGSGKFDIEDIDAQKCTHLTYSFIGLKSDGNVKILDDWNDIQLKGFTRFVNLKKKNPSLKVLVSMGGWGDGSETYSKVTNNAALRKVMVNSVYDFVTKWKFDGFDLDWEYPAQRGGAASDKKSYISFLKELRAKFGTKLLITAAVGASQDLIGKSYDVPSMNQYLDFINLMTYDFSGSWSSQTGLNAPLYSGNGDPNSGANSHTAVQNWIKNGASPQKLFLGLAFYGRSFTLADANKNGLNAKVTGPGTAGPYSKEAGLLMYLEICQEINKGGWKQVYDNDRKSPYMSKGKQWVGFDNEKSIGAKVKYAKDKNLAGVMIWAIDYDDAKNLCGNGKFPLLKSISNNLKK